MLGFMGCPGSTTVSVMTKEDKLMCDRQIQQIKIASLYTYLETILNILPHIFSFVDKFISKT